MEHANLNNLDYIVLSIILLSGLLALMRGFVREVASLITWTGAFIVTAKYYPLAEPWAHRYIKQETTVTYAAMGIVFCAAFVVLGITGAIITHLIVRGQAITAINRSLGFLFGLGRGALIVCLLYLVASATIWPDLGKPPVEEKQVKLDVQPSQQIDITKEDSINQDKDKKDNEPAPEWVMKARTRPFMAYGAAELKEFVPEDLIEKETQKLVAQKASAQRTIQEHASDILATPGAVSVQPADTPGYDDKNRANLNQLIEQRGRP